METLSTRLLGAMTDAGLNASQLASKVGATEATISNWLNGNVQTDHVKAALLLRIASAIGVNPSWLLNGQGRRHTAMSVADPSASQPVKIEVLTIAVQLVAEALKGLTLPPPKHAEVTALVYELLDEGMPEAKVLRFARAAAA